MHLNSRLTPCQKSLGLRQRLTLSFSTSNGQPFIRAAPLFLELMSELLTALLAFVCCWLLCTRMQRNSRLLQLPATLRRLPSMQECAPNGECSAATCPLPSRMIARCVQFVHLHCRRSALCSDVICSLSAAPALTMPRQVSCAWGWLGIAEQRPQAEDDSRAGCSHRR